MDTSDVKYQPQHRTSRFWASYIELDTSNGHWACHQTYFPFSRTFCDHYSMTVHTYIIIIIHTLQFSTKYCGLNHIHTNKNNTNQYSVVGSSVTWSIPIARKLEYVGQTTYSLTDKPYTVVTWQMPTVRKCIWLVRKSLRDGVSLTEWSMWTEPYTHQLNDKVYTVIIW